MEQNVTIFCTPGGDKNPGHLDSGGRVEIMRAYIIPL